MCNLSRGQFLKDFLIGNVQNGLFQPGNTLYGHEENHQNGYYKTYCVLYGLTMVQWLGYDVKETLGYEYEQWENYQNVGAAMLYHTIKTHYKNSPNMPVIDDYHAKALSRMGYLVTVHTIWNTDQGHMAIVYPDLTPEWKSSALKVIQAGRYNQLNYEHQAYPLDTCQGKLFWIWRPGKMMAINNPNEQQRQYKIWYKWRVDNVLKV